MAKKKCLPPSKVSDKGGHPTSYEQILLESLDESLSTMGTKVKTSVYFHLEEKFRIRREEIPQRIEDFTNAIEKIFGLSAEYLEVLFIKNIHNKMNNHPDQPIDGWASPELTFPEYVNHIKQKLEKENTTKEETLSRAVQH